MNLWRAAVDNPAILIRLLHTIRRVAARASRASRAAHRGVLRAEADAVWECALERHRCNARTEAYLVAVDRVRAAYDMRGIE